MYDFLVIGSGISGLWFALRAAKHGKVCVITKRDRMESNTRYAQGGVAAVFSDEDSFESHIRDTEIAGAGLCDKEAVRVTITEGPIRVQELIEAGVQFTREEDNSLAAYDMGKEGGHSERRVLHSGDITGEAIQKTIVAKITSHPNIDLFENHSAIDLITMRRITHRCCSTDRCLGAYVFDITQSKVKKILAKSTLLATGGIGKVYLYTSNPDVATGDGIAIAYRAGASIQNMEFVQFHPTVLYHSKAKNFLISEALRGEGGELRNNEGLSFMKGKHPMGSLAPRDIVARGIDGEMKRTGADCVFLDMTHLDPFFLVKRFPNIHKTCMSFGVDMRIEPIPVVPAAHYACGGVRVDLNSVTSIPGLYAVGETSSTGLHGANRLASNSLLEGLVFSHRAADHAKEYIKKIDSNKLPFIRAWNTGHARVSDEVVVVTQNWDEIRRFMWNYVGIVRTNRRLIRAQNRINNLLREIRDYFWEYEIDNDVLELRNIAMVAKLIIESALRRKESRGLHFTLDYLRKDPNTQPSEIDRLELEGVHWLRVVPQKTS